MSGKYIQGHMHTKSLVDLPNEVIEKYLLVYLSNSDIRAFSKTGNKRFERISERVLEKPERSKHYVI